MAEKTIEQIKDDIVLAALDHVIFDGWSHEALERGAEDAGYDVQKLRAVFPGRIEGALDHFADMADRWMLERLAELSPEDMRVRDRIRTAVVARFEALEPHKEAVRRSLSYWGLPLRQGRAGKIVWRSADRIWSWAGDTSTDYNFYTKRGLLSGILASSIVVWCQDDDPSMKKTTGFLDARIGNVMSFGRIIGQLKNKVFASSSAS